MYSCQQGECLRLQDKVKVADESSALQFRTEIANDK